RATRRPEIAEPRRTMLRYTNYLAKRYSMPEGWTLSAYEKDGGYQQAKRALGMTRGAGGPHESRANPRPRGRRRPARGEVELHALAAKAREAALPRDQRRRGRARDLQGPDDHGAEPPLRGRGLHHRLLRHRRPRRVHLRARRAPPLEGPALGRHRGGSGQR